MLYSFEPIRPLLPLGKVVDLLEAQTSLISFGAFTGTTRFSSTSMLKRTFFLVKQNIELNPLAIFVQVNLYRIIVFPFDIS